MTDDLATKLRTTGAFDSPWLKNELETWDVSEEQKKADFMEHMYQCSGRVDAPPGVKGLYTGLWFDFCLNEAGVAMREKYFEMLEAIRLYETGKLEMESVIFL